MLPSPPLYGAIDSTPNAIGWSRQASISHFPSHTACKYKLQASNSPSKSFAARILTYRVFTEIPSTVPPPLFSCYGEIVLGRGILRSSIPVDTSRVDCLKSGSISVVVVNSRLYDANGVA